MTKCFAERFFLKSACKTRLNRMSRVPVEHRVAVTRYIHAGNRKWSLLDSLI